jgi:RNA polymerase sigma-70 factor (ECF subfamily)
MHASPDVIKIDNAFSPSASCAAPLACPDDGLSAFLSARPRLFGIAYRMLGSAAEAEDIVQDVWIRWQTTDRRPVGNPLAFLVTATTRLAINVLQSARARREADVGPSLPEPVDTSPDPGLAAERGEALNLAVLLLLERLSSIERAAYVLREAFNYPYRHIADILRVEEANARQLVTRAREHVSGARRARVSPTEHRRLLNAFVAAARTGDLARLEGLLAADVVSTADGGGGWLRAAPASRSSRARRQVHHRRRGTLPETSRTLLRSTKRPSWTSSPHPGATFSNA